MVPFSLNIGLLARMSARLIYLVKLMVIEKYDVSTDGD